MSKSQGGRSALTAALAGGEGADPPPSAAARSRVLLDPAAFPCLASVLGKSSKPAMLAPEASASTTTSGASDTVGELASGFERVKLRGNDAVAGSAPTAHVLPDGSAAVRTRGREREEEREMRDEKKRIGIEKKLRSQVEPRAHCFGIRTPMNDPVLVLSRHIVKFPIYLRTR